MKTFEVARDGFTHNLKQYSEGDKIDLPAEDGAIIVASGWLRKPRAKTPQGK